MRIQWKARVDHLLGQAESGGRRPWRKSNEFRDNDFSGADLKHVSFRGGVDLNLQRFPVGGKRFVVQSGEAALSQAWAEVQGWPEDEYKSRAEIVLEGMFDLVRGGQKQLLVEKKRISRKLSEERADGLASIFLRFAQ
ncbi:hypothetical protein AB0F88_34475 [Streptosporangium sp. NPDC023963]|uniref:hypothetical protein n=1 Tax=Streptosporangium sp. NPDC023963 TaxID=3155608 RepID=UPI0034262EA7